MEEPLAWSYTAGKDWGQMLIEPSSPQLCGGRWHLSLTHREEEASGSPLQSGRPTL